MDSSLKQVVSRLATGSTRHAGRDPAARARLAIETARCTATAAADLVREAVAIKRATAPTPADGTAWAEETATGPLATLRLLLITARCLGQIAAERRPRQATGAPRFGRGAGGRKFVEVGVLPEPGLSDVAIFGGHTATVRCIDPGGPEAFERAWRDEAARRSAAGGVAVVLGAGNVTALSVGDGISQIFEHGRSVVLKPHPVHAALEPVFRRALAPLIEADLLEIVPGGTDVAAALVALPEVGHVHLTGGEAAFDAVVWGCRGPHRAGDVPRLSKPITCELGNVTPWIIVPARYSAAELKRQADCVAASILNNTSFNCIATKCLVTCRGWDQREAFLAAVARRLAAAPARQAWYPGATGLWEQATGTAAPADGSLPWVLRQGIDPARDGTLLDREWFVPVAAEVPLDASGIDDFCARATELCRRLPGTLAASVTLPRGLSPHDARRADLLVEHLEYGTVAVNTWSALAYATTSVPWGGFPGATLAEPGSGIGWVHDPHFLPLVHNTVLRAPLSSWMVPAWFPWHAGGERLASGVVGMYGSRARGQSSLPQLLAMLPAALGGGG
ncbi:MAG: aldehyde dehydrogenase family protein [Planctomycetota bacterium]